jgi:hypothetical protein
VFHRQSKAHQCIELEEVDLLKDLAVDLLDIISLLSQRLSQLVGLKLLEVDVEQANRIWLQAVEPAVSFNLFVYFAHNFADGLMVV